MKIKILPNVTTTKNLTKTKFKSALGIAGQLITCASMNRPPWRRGFVLVGLILACFALAPQARATCQEGCNLPLANTFLGDDALINNTTGVNNTAIGVVALYDNTTGSQNTANGVLALFSNNADWNTATGFAALQGNTTGFENTATGAGALNANTTGSDNTATGLAALFSNTTGSGNTATGYVALYSNTTGFENTATGAGALGSNTTGNDNTANGFQALSSNISGGGNLAVGTVALRDLTSGGSNVAVGNAALVQGVTVNFNSALGRRALFRSQGDQNVGLGFFAGSNLNDGGTNNIYLGNVGPVPIGSESNTIRIGTQTATTATIGQPPVESHPMPAHTATFIAGIYSTPVAKGLVVKVDSTGHLGTVGSSGRFKEKIKPMGNASEAILALKPVTFRYKKEIDPERTPEFGLVAEDVEKVNPDLVARDEQGKPYTVRYDAVNAMLLNEFLKEHKKVEEQQATIAELKSTVAEQRKNFEAISMQQHAEIQALMANLKEQASQIQKVSAHIEMGKFATGRIRRGAHAPQVVLNNR